ncbi:unnamed protein product [Zymoseptoria tritici ST99CH_3D1]|nr:unnamed protein product [Zymoseptoria tritici ST99CH_3D1]
MAHGHASHARPQRRDSGYSQQSAPDHGKTPASIAENTTLITADQVVEPEPDSDEDAPGELDDDPEFSSHPAPNIYTPAVAGGPSSPKTITPAAPPPVRVVLIPPTPVISTFSNNHPEKRSSRVLPTTTSPHSIPQAKLPPPQGRTPNPQSTLATNPVSTSSKSTGPRPKPSSPPSESTAVQHPLPPQPTTHPILPSLPPTSTPCQLFTHPPPHPTVIKVSDQLLLASTTNPFPEISPFHRLLSPTYQLCIELDRQEGYRREQHAKWRGRLETRWVWRERRGLAWERGLRPRGWVGPVETGSGGVEPGVFGRQGGDGEDARMGGV